MKTLSVLALTALAGAGLVLVQPQTTLSAETTKATQTVTRAGSFAATQGPATTFTGRVRVERIFKATEAAPYTAASVTFEPGARTFWHSHVAGQHLIVVHGVGLTGTADGRVVEIRPGDEVWCPPHVKHWHGATATSSMPHIAITGIKDGKSTTWLEEVTEAQYTARPDRK